MKKRSISSTVSAYRMVRGTVSTKGHSAIGNWVGKGAYLLVALGISTVMGCSKDGLRGADGKLNGEDGAAGLRSEVELRIIGGAEVTVGFQAQAQISAQLVFVDNGLPVPNHEVTWGLSAGAAGSSLPTTTTLTDAFGKVHNSVTTGSSRTTFKVYLASKNRSGYADARAEAEITIDGLYKGDLRVAYAYAGPITVSQLDTRVHQGPLTCAALNYQLLPQHLAQQEGTNTAQRLTFSGLTENEMYSVTVTGKGPLGNTVVYGCAVASPLTGRSVTDVVVNLDLKAATLTGMFDFGTHLQITDALPGTTGEVVTRLNDFFMDPAQALGDALVAELATQTGQSESTVRTTIIVAWMLATSSFGGSTNGGVADANGDGAVNLSDPIDFYLLDKMPDWANNTMLTGGDLTSALTNLTVGGKLEIDSATPEGALTGHWDWSDFLLQWRSGSGCDPTNSCCGRTTYSGDELGFTPFGADFTATATPRQSADRIEYDFVIDEHRLDFQYGALILFALNEFVLPSVTGQDNLLCATESLLGCDDLAVDGATFTCGATNTTAAVGVNDTACGCARTGRWLSDTIGIVGASVGTGVCNFAVAAVALTLEDQLMGAASSGGANDYLTMTVTGVLADDDQDLQADLITGVTAGNLFSGGGSSAFSGDILADIERTACTSNSGCGTDESCQGRFDPLNDCIGRLVCVPRVGAKLAGQSCTENTECMSGTCLSAGICFEACSEDLDCSGSLLCNTATAVNVPVGEVILQTNSCGVI